MAGIDFTQAKTSRECVSMTVHDFPSGTVDPGENLKGVFGLATGGRTRLVKGREERSGAVY